MRIMAEPESVEGLTMDFDWHSGAITRTTPLDKDYRNTQNVRRFLRQECGDDFRFDRDFMAWVRSGAARHMGDVADEWLRRRASGTQSHR
ncbi:MAG: hypothetical protein JWP29_4303 [Rhodoferax sp.]|nr:hypothetical protein [Rhodoferax sp.]